MKTSNVEAKRIDTRWQNFLNLKRLWNGGKKAAVKVGEHFVESNPWGKGAGSFAVPKATHSSKVLAKT